MDAADWDVRYAGTDLLWSVEPNQFVVQETAHLPAGRALDLGCGEGRNALWLAERGWAVTGVDFSQTAIDRARSIADHRDGAVDWVREDVLASTAPEDAPFYDLVLLSSLH
nr:class I SAM-dependent methyltransferase [Micromonospora sp. DSM 115978]